MNTRSLAALAGVVALFSGSAIAETPNYNYLELSFSGGDVEGTELPDSSIDIGGGELEGSIVIGDSLLLMGEFSALSEDLGGLGGSTGDLDIDTFAVSIGIIREVGDNSALDLSFQYRDDEAEVDDLGEVEFDGPALLIGIRSNITDSLEVYGRLGYLLGNYEGGTSTDLGVVWNFSDAFAATFAYEVSDVDDDDLEYQLDQWQLGVRWKFN